MALPPSPEPEKLEVILSLGAKQGFVPLLGYARLSGLYFLLSQGEQSIEVLQNIVDLVPQEICLQELLADMQNTLGRKEQALDHYRACANLDPFASRIREKMAQVYSSLGRTEEAKAEWTKFQILDPTKPTPIH